MKKWVECDYCGFYSQIEGHKDKIPLCVNCRNPVDKGTEPEEGEGNVENQKEDEEYGSCDKCGRDIKIIFLCDVCGCCFDCCQCVMDEYI